MEIGQVQDVRLIGAYRQLRDRKEAMVEKQRAEVKPLDTAMKQIETELLRRMQERGSDSTKTDEGTAFKTTVASIKVENSGAFFDWLTETGHWECAEIRGAKKEVEAYMEKHEALPPGLNINRMVKCGVRKPTGVN